jgi:hypothetical protein
VSAPAPRESCKNSEEEVEKNEKKRDVSKKICERERGSARADDKVVVAFVSFSLLSMMRSGRSRVRVCVCVCVRVLLSLSLSLSLSRQLGV